MNKYSCCRALDISEDLCIIRWKNGIKLFKSGSSSNLNRLVESNSIIIPKLLKLPFAVYFQDTKHVTLQCNQITAEECGFATVSDCIGNEWFNNFITSSVISSIQKDAEVITHNTIKIACLSAQLNNGNSVETLSIRVPWYNNQNKIIGLFGCSLIMGKIPLVDFLLQISNLGLLHSTELNHVDNLTGDQINFVYLSKRELDCLRLTIRGKTAISIANTLGLSKWTVEEYLANIKRKMNVSSKAELIDKTIDHFISNSFSRKN